MSVSRKVGSAGLAILIAAIAVAGASTCPRELSPMSSSDPAMAMMGMPMPGMDSSQLGITEARTDLCCQVSPAELPKQTSQISANSAAGLAAPDLATLQASGADKLTAFEAHARMLAPPPQSFLCVFLI